MKEYLATSNIIDWQNPEILQLAEKLSDTNIESTAKNCFEWVRDNINHSSD